jgi:hypothetical protein
MQIIHKLNQLTPGGVPHEKTDYKITLKIKIIMESILTDDEQAEKHRDDENTTWFGVLREKGELPMFQDYGCYANLMASVAGGDAVGVETKFPGSVSFVGQTGLFKASFAFLLL